MTVQMPTWRLHPLEEAVCGASAAGVACLFSNPLDIARVRLQLTTGRLDGPLRVITRAVKAEGVVVLTRGLGFALGYNAVFNFARFGVFEVLSGKFEQDRLVAVYGVIAGGLAGFLSSPLAKARTLRQRAGLGVNGALEPRATALQTLRHHPFHGSLLWAVRNGGHTGIVFSMYSLAKSVLTKEMPGASTPLVHVAAALQASITSCVLMNPIDMVSTRMYSQALEVTYSSPLDCMRKTVAVEGVGALYRGLTANVLRTVPHTVITLSLMELLRSTLRDSALGCGRQGR
ncbi:mitochondrial carrier domain-containing protein [Pavlovales sp. CCMP2436]|nr:mitochondrial carrier domain-containing protein [Pavlovales sp. CCMP2436]